MLSGVPTLPFVIHAPRPDGGRTVIEAVIALTIVAITAVAWSRMAIAADRVDSLADHRGIALDLATAEIERLRIMDPSAMKVDPASKGAVTSFEGLPVVTDATGLDATVAGSVGQLDATVLRLVLDPGPDTWRRIVVIVTWTEAGRQQTVRLDTGVPVLPPPKAI